jgi:hypothetical protein
MAYHSSPVQAGNGSRLKVVLLPVFATPQKRLAKMGSHVEML